MAVREHGALRLAVAGLRLALGVLILVAVSVQYADSSSRAPFSAVNFFSFFTIDSNLLAAGVLLAGAAAGVLHRPAVPERIRGAAALYMTVTGVVFALLLARIPADEQGTLPWVNAVVHQVAPLSMLADWVLLGPRRRLPFRATLAWLAFPLLFLTYSLLRGPSAHFYPYPFLDPRGIGYEGVLLHCAGIALFFVAAAWAIISLGAASAARRALTD